MLCAYFGPHTVQCHLPCSGCCTAFVMLGWNLRCNWARRGSRGLAPKVALANEGRLWSKKRGCRGQGYQGHRVEPQGALRILRCIGESQATCASSPFLQDSNRRPLGREWFRCASSPAPRTPGSFGSRAAGNGPLRETLPDGRTSQESVVQTLCSFSLSGCFCKYTYVYIYTSLVGTQALSGSEK